MKSSEHRSVWFWSLIICGLIPLGCRWIVYIAGSTTHYFELSELIFFSITLSVANLTSIGHLEINNKMQINLSSLVLAFVLGIFLAFSMVDGIEKGTNYGFFRLVVWFLTATAVVYSYRINEKCFKYYEAIRKKETRRRVK